MVQYRTAVQALLHLDEAQLHTRSNFTQTDSTLRISRIAAAHIVLRELHSILWIGHILGFRLCLACIGIFATRRLTSTNDVLGNVCRITEVDQRSTVPFMF